MKKLCLALFLILVIAVAGQAQSGQTVVTAIGTSLKIQGFTIAGVPLTTNYNVLTFSLVAPDGTDTIWTPTSSGGNNDCTSKTYELYCEVTAAQLNQIGTYTLSWSDCFHTAACGTTWQPGFIAFDSVCAACYNLNYTTGPSSLSAQATYLDANSTAHLVLLNALAEMAQGAPTATPTVSQALMYIYMALRNQITVTGSSKTFSNDAGTVIWKKALSDNGTTFTEAEGATGP